MANDENDLTERRGAEMRLMTAFVEMLSADGVVVIYSWNLQGKTGARMATWGNGLLAKSMIDWAYGEVFKDEEEPEEDDEDEDCED